MKNPEKQMDSTTASILLESIERTGDLEGGANLYKMFLSDDASGPTDEQRTWFEQNRGKRVLVKDTAMVGVVRSLNEATNGLCPGSRYPIYIMITHAYDNGAIGQSFEYDIAQLELIN